MKKYMFAIAIVAVSATAVIGLSSFTIQPTQIASEAYMLTLTEKVTEFNMAATGGKCGHGISCRCTGFKPKSSVGSGTLYCKNCGHHKNYHH